MVFSTQVTSGWPVTSAIAAATSSATAIPEPGGIERLLVEQRRARQPVGAGQRVIPAPLDVLAAGAQLAAQQGGPADLGQGGQHGQRGGPAGLPGQQRLGPAVAGPRQHAGDHLGAHPGAHPVQDEQQHRRAAGQRQDHLGQQVLQVPDARRGCRTRRRGSSLVCAASAGANAASCAARRARTAARTAASPAPRSGSLAPGAASLTAESTQASLSPMPVEQRLQGRRADGGAPRQPARQPHRGVERRRARVGVRRAGGWPPGSTPARRRPGRRRRIYGRSGFGPEPRRPRGRHAARPPATRAAGSARKAAGPSRRPGRRRGWRRAVRRRGRAGPRRWRGSPDPGASRP